LTSFSQRQRRQNVCRKLIVRLQRCVAPQHAHWGFGYGALGTFEARSSLFCYRRFGGAAAEVITAFFDNALSEKKAHSQRKECTPGKSTPIKKGQPIDDRPFFIDN
jgi:hypothetical protein